MSSGGKSQLNLNKRVKEFNTEVWRSETQLNSNVVKIRKELVRE